MSAPHLPLRAVLISLALIVSLPATAHASRGFKLFTTGDAIAEIGPVKPGFIAELPPEGKMLTKVGFKYEHFGLFWLDIWNWSGEYCITDGDSYMSFPGTKEEQKAVAANLLGIPENQLGTPLNYKVPYGMAIIVGLILLKIGASRLKAKKRQQACKVPEFDPGPPPSPPGGPPPIPPPP